MSVVIKALFDVSDALKSANELKKTLEDATSSLDSAPITKEMKEAVTAIEKFNDKVDAIGDSFKDASAEVREMRTRIKELQAENDTYTKQRIASEQKLANLEKKRDKYRDIEDKQYAEYKQQGLSEKKAREKSYNIIPPGETKTVGALLPAAEYQVDKVKDELQEINELIDANNAKIAQFNDAIEGTANGLNKQKAYLEQSTPEMEKISASWDEIYAKEQEALKLEDERVAKEKEEQKVVEQSADTKEGSETTEPEKEVEDIDLGQPISQWKAYQQEIEHTLDTIAGYEKSIEMLKAEGVSEDELKPMQDQIDGLRQYVDIVREWQAELAHIDMSSVFDKGDIEGTASRLRAHLQDIVDSVEGVNLSSRFQSLADSIEKVLQESQAVDAEMKALEHAKAPTAEYTELLNSLDAMEKKERALSEKKADMETVGDTSSKAYQKTLTDLEAMHEQVQAIKDEMARMEESGDAFVPGSATARYQELLQQQAELNNRMRIYSEKWSESVTKMGEASGMNIPPAGGGDVDIPNPDNIGDADKALRSLMQTTRGFARLIPGFSARGVMAISMLSKGMDALANVSGKTLTAAIKKLGSAVAKFTMQLLKNPVFAAVAAAIVAIVVLIKKVKKDIDDVKKSLEQLGKIGVSSLKAVGKALANIAKFSVKGFVGLGVGAIKGLLSGISALIDKLMSLKSVVTENIKIMAKWNNGHNAVNKAMTNLTSSLAYLKAALTSAFVPILTVVEPILTSLMDKIANLLTLIGMLIAKLSGATHFQKAIKKQKDYAAALDKSGKAAKKALAPFDELNILQSQQGGGEAVDFGMVDLEKVNFPEWMQDFEKLKEMAYEFGKLVGTKLRDWLNSIPWDEIQDKARKTAEVISAFINGLLDVEGLGKAIGHSLGEALNTLVDFMNTALTEIHWGQLGKQLGEGVQEIVDTVEWDELGQMFANAFNSAFDVLYHFFVSFDGSTLGSGLTTLFQNAVGGIDWPLIWRTLAEGIRDLTGMLNNLITPENFALIGETIANGLNTIAFAIGEFVKGINWEQYGDSIATGINTLFESWDAETAGANISKLASSLLDMLLKAVEGINWEQIADKLVEFISNIDWKGLSAKAKQISTSLREHLDDVWDELEKSGALDDVIDLIVTFISEKKHWEKFFKAVKFDFMKDLVIEKIKSAFSGMNFIDTLKSVLPQISIAELISRIFMGQTGETDVSQIFGELDWGSIGENIIKGIANGLNSGLSFLLGPLRGVFTAIFSGIQDLFGIHSPSTEMEPIGENIIAGIAEGFNLFDFIGAMQQWWDENIAPWFTIEKWQEIAQNIKDALDGKIEELKLSMTEKWTNIKENISKKVEELKANLQTKWENIKTTVSEKVELLKTGVIEKWELLKTSISEAVENLKTGLAEKWELIRTGAVEAWNAIKDGLKTPINGIISLVENMINFVIDGINSLTSKLGSIDVPDWLADKVGVSSISIPQISNVSLPRLAQGAVLPPNNPFLAMVGDQKSGTNIEAPLSTIQEALLGALQQSGLGNGEQVINVYLGTNKIYSEIKKLEKRDVVMGG